MERKFEGPLAYLHLEFIFGSNMHLVFFNETKTMLGQEGCYDLN